MMAIGMAANSRARTNGDANRLAAEDRAVHDWYRFVLSFPPHLVRDYVKRFGVTGRRRVLDPFCGTGTTLVECKKLGIPSVGTEINLMPLFATQTKLDWTPDPDGLVTHATRVAEMAQAEIDPRATLSGEGLAPLERTTHLRTLPREASDLLLTDSISPLPLHKVLVLLDWIEQLRDERYHAHERLALARTVVQTASNLEFGPEVGVGAPQADAPVVAAWLSAVEMMADDLREVGHLADVPAQAIAADARDLSDDLEPCSVDAVITSPPYPNEKDYTRTTRLESVVLGHIRSRAELRALKTRLVRSNTRGVYRIDTDDLWVLRHGEIQRIATEIEARRIELGKTSGFERLYSRVTKLYFGGMARHLYGLRPLLRPGAQLAYVVGDQASYLRVMIRTGQLLGDIAQSLGYEVVGIELFRTRLATATREQLREEVVVLRWPRNAQA